MENGGNIDDISGIEEYDSDDEDEYDTLDYDYMNTLQKLKNNNPAVSTLSIDLNGWYEEAPYFNSIDWKENGSCISDNTQLKKFHLYSNDSSSYTLGDQGQNLPTRQRLQDFFLCIYRNKFITDIIISSIDIIDEFGWGLIQGLSGHHSLERLEIADSSLGRIGCSAIEKILNHPMSKLEDLRLPNDQLVDKSLGILCNGLSGNSTFKRLCLRSDKPDDGADRDITSVGWRALSTVIRHPNCKLVKLYLQNSGINNESANFLGSALCCLSSLKVLSLSFNRSISSSLWPTFLSQLSQTSIESLDIGYNYIEDDGLLMLTNIGSLKSLDIRNMRFSSPRGWQSFIIALQRRGTQLVRLDLSYNCICNESVADLGNLLGSMSSLKTLKMDCLVCPNDSDDITSQGWVTFFRSLQDSNLDLTRFDFDNNLDNVGMELLIQLVTSMTSMKHLRLIHYSATPVGWQPLTDYLQSPNFALKVLYLNGSTINDDTVVAFASALAHNRTLKFLSLDDCTDDDGNDLITNRGWDAVSNIICNKTSIMDTYNSNHTLQFLGERDLPDDLTSYLELNKNKHKVEVPRQKILQTHFSGSADDSSNIQEFLDMDLNVMPAAIEWIGRDLCGLSAMYNLTRRLPDLFDSSAKKKKLNAAKRKRGV